MNAFEASPSGCGAHAGQHPASGRTATAAALEVQLLDTQARLARLQAHLAGLHHEVQALETTLLEPATLGRYLQGKCLVYVGGRPRSNASLRALVRQAGGEFIVHAGLVDDDARPSGFASLLPGADKVFCPLDLIDAESLLAVRRLCARHGVAWQPLRSASVASFIAGLERQPLANAPDHLGHRQCMRHG